MQELEPYIGKKQDFQWILDNVAYLGKGKKARTPPDAVIAYDRTLLKKGNGTNVLFNDHHVEFRTPEQLEKLGIAAGEVLLRDVQGLPVSPHRKLLDERTLIAVNNQDQFGAKWFKVEREYETASRVKKQQMIRKWMADAQKPDVKIRSSAIASLGNIACKQATNLMMKIAQEPLEFSRSNRPRWIAVRGLGRIGDKRAVPVLIDLLDHYNENTQLYARVALCEITGAYFGADKAKWRKWWQQKGKKLAELDLSSPASTVISFTKAAAAGDVELALACFAPDSHDYEDAKELLTGAETNPLRMMLDAVDPDARIIIVSMEMAEEGTRCSIKWRMVLKRGFTIEGQTFKAGETFDLDGNVKKVGDRWLIVGI
ncbi:hypothetical protein ES703_10210 [subsurface metagenome]